MLYSTVWVLLSSFFILYRLPPYNLQKLLFRKLTKNVYQDGISTAAIIKYYELRSLRNRNLFLSS